MKIPFSPPYIDNSVIEEVTDSLQSGWITTGPKTKLLEKELASYCSVQKMLCLNSATAGLELMLRWFGVKEGDEVIVPAYTYCATANVVLHCGATPVMVDCDKNFLIDVEKVKQAITSKTKAIMPVDVFGYPCDYDALNELINSTEIKQKFKATAQNQEKLGRVLLLSDAAHSIGAQYHGKKIGSQADAMIFSFHAVKNLTTAEGGAIAINLPEPFLADDIYRELSIKALHGQNKDAMSKTQSGAWRYDIIEAGYKFNMPDVLAAIGLASFRQYESHILPRRKMVFDFYSQQFSKYDWAQVPEYENTEKTSSYHVYPLRIKGITEEERDAIIQKMFDAGISTNVHFQPLPLLSLYKNLGYNISDYPVSFDNYSREISLPVYPQLKDEQLNYIVSKMAATVGNYVEKTV